MKKSALGRGLDVLLPDNEFNSENKIQEIAITSIDRNASQPRQSFNDESIAELAESIKSAGVLQPLIVCEKMGRYEIIAGERRFRAARAAGLDTVPCIVRDMNENERMEAALIENLQREDLNAVDEARAIRQLIVECGYTQENAAKRLGMSRPALTNLLRILVLPDDILDMVISGELTEGHARVLCSLESEGKRRQIARRIVLESLSVRETELLCAEIRNPKDEKKPRVQKSVPQLVDFEERLRRVFCVKTRVSGGLKRGKVVFQYSSQEELQYIYQCLEYLESK